MKRARAALSPDKKDLLWLVSVSSNDFLSICMLSYVLKHSIRFYVSVLVMLLLSRIQSFATVDGIQELFFSWSVIVRDRNGYHTLAGLALDLGLFFPHLFSQSEIYRSICAPLRPCSRPSPARNAARLSFSPRNRSRFEGRSDWLALDVFSHGATLRSLGFEALEDFSDGFAHGLWEEV